MTLRRVITKFHRNITAYYTIPPVVTFWTYVIRSVVVFLAIFTVASTVGIQGVQARVFIWSFSPSNRYAIRPRSRPYVSVVEACSFLYYIDFYLFSSPPPQLHTSRVWQTLNLRMQHSSVWFKRNDVSRNPGSAHKLRQPPPP